MPTPLKLLLVEDSTPDADLVLRVLRQSGFEPQWRRVESAPDFEAALDPSLDIVISDYSMPDFSALGALALLQGSGHDVPFVIVSGTIGEETAVEAMRLGATDYLLKDRLARLGQVVRQALVRRLERRAARQAEVRQAVQYQVSRALAEEEGIAEAAARVLEIVRLASAWDGGALWTRRLRGDLLRCIATSGDAALRPFLVETERMTLSPGCGLGGRAWASGHLASMPDLAAEPDFLRRPAALACGLVAGFAVPIRCRGESVGVLEFFSRRPIDLGRDVVDMLEVIGGQVGLYLRRHQAEEARDESQQRFFEMASSIQEVFWISSPDFGTVHYVNPAYERIWGRTCRSLYENPHSFLDPVHPDDRAVIQSELEKWSRGERSFCEYRLVRDDGTVVWIRDRGFPVVDERGRLQRVAGIAEDITEAKDLERRFLQAQKMEAVGQLAGGVAHDFNNMLTAIVGYGELLLSTLSRSDPRRGFVQEIADAGERAAGLTRQLLAFSRQQVLETRVFDLNEVVDGMEKMVKRLIGENIRLQCPLSHQPLPVKADPGQIEQVVMNLAVNARDAMPYGGVLTLETSAIVLDVLAARSHDELLPGPYVQLTVTDTGSGMTDHVKAHVFEPFFTTKEKGRGTGLGLATCFGIVKQSAGHISVVSELGHGTVFRVLLPLVEAREQESEGEAHLEGQAGGSETVLIVEDEAAVRQLTAHVLRSLGYRVLEADDGEEALRIVTEHGAAISLVVTDVIMPNMDGRTLQQRMSLLGSTAPFLFCSGYTDDAISHHGVLEAGVAFLQKPFTPAVLAARVREVLDAPRRS